MNFIITTIIIILCSLSCQGRTFVIRIVNEKGQTLSLANTDQRIINRIAEQFREMIRMQEKQENDTQSVYTDKGEKISFAGANLIHSSLHPNNNTTSKLESPYKQAQNGHSITMHAL